MYAVILHVSSGLHSSNSGLQSFQAVKFEEKCLTEDTAIVGC
jgi:hypothetical protein